VKSLERGWSVLLAVLDDEEPSINLSNSCGLYAHSLGLSHITSLFPPNFCCPRCCELYPRCRHDLRREYSGRWRAHPVPHTAVRTWLLCLWPSFSLFYPGFIAERRTIASTSARQADITLTVDGKEVTVPQGTLEANLGSQSLIEGRS